MLSPLIITSWIFAHWAKCASVEMMGTLNLDEDLTKDIWRGAKILG